MMGTVIIGGGGTGGGTSGGWDPSNKAVLSKLGDAGGKLTYDGKAISPAGQETSYTVVLTAAVIAQGYLELPDDCDTSEGQPVIVMYAGQTPERGRDWILLEFADPQKDRIVWEGYLLPAQLLPGTDLLVTYHKKI